MKGLLRAFRNFFILFAVFVVLSIILAKSESTRNFLTPDGVKIDPDAEFSPAEPGR